MFWLASYNKKESNKNGLSTTASHHPLWSCWNGLAIDFKEEETKTGNNIYIAKQYQTQFNPVKCFLAATSLACSNVAKHFKIILHADWLICNLFSSQGWHVPHDMSEWSDFTPTRLLKTKHLEIHGKWFLLISW